MATLHRDRQTGRYLVLAKGAVERIVGTCTAQMAADGTTGPLAAEAVLHTAADLAGQGLRVLATAVRRDGAREEFDERALPGTLVLTGLQAMHEPPRPAAAAAVRACHTAGITVKMITGDHAVTATAVAGRLGLFHGSPGSGGPRVLTGAELAALPASRATARVWRELGDLFGTAGDSAAMMDAYRRALESAGLRSSPQHSGAVVDLSTR